MARKAAEKSSPQEEERRKLLEEALGFLMPPQQAQRKAALLWERFGGFMGVFLAPQGELALALGENGAKFCGLVSRVARAYLEEGTNDLKRVYDTPSAIELFRPKFLGRTTEAVALMLLDSRGRLLYNDLVCEGSVSAVPIYIRRLVQLCITYDAQYVFLAHNHPSGNALPSTNDVTSTHQVEAALECIDATLNDHIIFAGEDTFSFHDSGWMAAIQREVRAGRREELQNARRLEGEFTS